MTNYLDWPVVSALPWRQRNAHVECAIRTYLAAKLPDFVISSMNLAQQLCPFDTCPGWYGITYGTGIAELAQTLAKMAPYMGPLATHDGEVIYRYGRQWRRWQWHGQGG